MPVPGGGHGGEWDPAPTLLGSAPAKMTVTELSSQDRALGLRDSSQLGWGHGL